MLIDNATLTSSGGKNKVKPVHIFKKTKKIIIKIIF